MSDNVAKMTVDQLLAAAPLAELGAGVAQTERRKPLTAIGESDFAEGGRLNDRDFARGCLAGLWLAYNFLDESHRISQEIETREGSYWHGLMHRREGDFANSKYWFRRVGEHPIHASLFAHAMDIAAERDMAKALDMPGGWSAERFVDICQQAVRLPHGDPSDSLTMLCRRIADAEWRMLFDYCRRRA